MKKLYDEWMHFIKLFNEYDVEYCIVGAEAVSFHARNRYSKDFDILINPSKENSFKVYNAVKSFFDSDLGLSPEDFQKEGEIFQFGYEPVRIDLLTRLDNLKTKDVLNKKVSGKYGSEPAYYISLTNLIKNKKVLDRYQDKDDLKYLIEAKSKAEKNKKRHRKNR